MHPRKLEELIDNQRTGWKLIKEWLLEAKNEITILKVDKKRSEKTLLNAQITTKSPLGAVIHETGGILIDDGWLRILGGGSETLNRSLDVWNKGKSFENYGDPWNFCLVADDILGGFWAINGGKFSKKLSDIYYFAPDTLEWEETELSYSDFIWWAFNGNLEKYYANYRWQNWKNDTKKARTEEVINFYPPLWSKFKNIDNLSKKAISINEAWSYTLKK